MRRLETSGLSWSSSTRTSSLRPSSSFLPPVPYSSPSLKPVIICLAYTSNGPVTPCRTPILIGSAAAGGAGGRGGGGGGRRHGATRPPGRAGARGRADGGAGGRAELPARGDLDVGPPVRRGPHDGGELVPQLLVARPRHHEDAAVGDAAGRRGQELQPPPALAAP